MMYYHHYLLRKGVRKMTDEQLYNILYTNGSCNMSQDILDILLDILREYCTNTKNVPLVGIDRWNLYCDSDSKWHYNDAVNYSHIHIVYRVYGESSYFGNSFDELISIV